MMVILGKGTKVTGSGTVEIEGRRVAGYICTDGTNSATVRIHDDSANGALIFHWDSAIPASFWPTLCPSGRVYYSVTGTGAHLQLFEVAV